MSPRLPIEAAEAAFRDLGGFAVDDPAAPPPARLIEAVRRFAAVEFDVSTELPDQDGLLFQYTPLGGSFLLGFVRQFELVDADGEHEGYVQLHADYELPPDPELTALGSYTDWWFRGGPESFDDWFLRVSTHPVWQRAAGVTPARFEIYADEV
ncbi:hypothetical protein ONA70_10290 [Micromonospora yasonensis]|uniref:hypothetical protein n=1 Tax=Micromonospora yasonensis TaxID=1128667 RepID=UPI002232636E|nr:hypothetical protein [Micromonospora yasonensis]MCW3840483.1 hypothetical protein [Micromonospora yasonensis]